MRTDACFELYVRLARPTLQRHSIVATPNRPAAESGSIASQWSE
jgi:hypothetical protein